MVFSVLSFLFCFYPDVDDIRNLGVLFCHSLSDYKFVVLKMLVSDSKIHMYFAARVNGANKTKPKAGTYSVGT